MPKILPFGIGGIAATGLTTGGAVVVPPGTPAGYIPSSDGTGHIVWGPPGGDVFGVVSLTIDGAGAAIEESTYQSPEFDFGGTFTGWDITELEVPGSITLDVWKKNAGVGWPPNSGDSIIAGGTMPFLSAESSNFGDCSDWDDPTFVSGDRLVFSIQPTPTSVQKVVLTLFYTRT